jgi:uncharacterized iron-regulated membrane protein
MTTGTALPLRAFWFQVHLWLGLTLGVVGVLIGLSGSILVYDHEIDAQLNPQRYAISGSQIALPYAEYAQRAEAALEGRARTTAIRLPDLEPGPVIVLARAKADSRTVSARLSRSGNGRGARHRLGPRLAGMAAQLSRVVDAARVEGREIVGVIGVAMLTSSLSGIYLWWPAGRIRVRAVGFRRGFALHRNLHYAFGIWGALVLATISFTGLFLAYQDAGRTVVANFASVSPSPRGLQSASSGGDAIALDEAVAIAQQRVGNAGVIGLGLPVGPTRRYRVNLREAGDTSARSTTVVFIDPRSRLHPAGGGPHDARWRRHVPVVAAHAARRQRLRVVWRFLVFLGGLAARVDDGHGTDDVAAQASASQVA